MNLKGIKLQIKDWKTTEIMVYWLIWLVILVLPLIFWDFSDYEQRRRIIGGWIRILPFFLIFLIHSQILLPGLLLKNKYTSYFITTILLILIINYLFIYNHFFHDLLFNLFGGLETKGEGFRDGAKNIRGHGRPQGNMGMGYGRGGNHRRWSTPIYLVYTYNVIISILIVSFNATLKFTTRWLKEDQKRKEIEKENLQSQLKSLQQQLSPHFFMNTLNNIHALIEYNKKDAQESILRLSQMMRYLLYDSGDGKTTLKKEIVFLKSYIDLVRLRLNDSFDLKLDFPKKIPDMDLYPYLFISFLENAFKHGIGTKEGDFIHVQIEIINDKIHFNIKNSKPDLKSTDEYSGIGIENTKKRLDLLYGKYYSLNIYNRENDFEVDLIFPYED